eukprot:CAMPEP_0117418702 /NCGR_PEP_ID=MMETSP0758-20121206/417_1 /TAXON_ID=63605 /ORGANISM="Percolomonas cosmopolitus, Strain AE-1 (ATCC 50343)" /LENGTH=76 /DNA_ID=CAMNT_0005199337 /DNA_START=546 /DNA_END=773 /DNA_ORIENTATION=-
MVKHENVVENEPIWTTLNKTFMNIVRSVQHVITLDMVDDEVLKTNDVLNLEDMMDRECIQGSPEVDGNKETMSHVW